MNSVIAVDGAPAAMPLCSREPLRSPWTRTMRGLTR